MTQFRTDGPDAAVPRPADARPQLGKRPTTADAADEAAALSDLDHALEHWARRHGGDAPVARALALTNHAVMQGHTCLALDAIPTALMAASQQRELPEALRNSLLVGRPGQVRPLILDNNRLYLQRYHAYETRLATRLTALMAVEPAPVDSERLRPGSGLFNPAEGGASATNWQAVAAFAALRHRFAVISGGPGTGKTYTIVRLLRVLIETALAEQTRPPLIALAAPTGKAADRMIKSISNGLEEMAANAGFDPTILQYIPRAAHTLHRLLGLTGATTLPRFDADNPLPADVVIIDEASMVDLPMMAKLADAIRADARLILLGDRYQLASVESGSVLTEICANAGTNRFTKAQQAAAGDLLHSPAKPCSHPLADHVVTLQTSRRFNSDSTIGRLAAAVNAGDRQAVQKLLAADHDDLLYHDTIDRHTINRLLDRLAGHYAKLIHAIDPLTAFDHLDRHCVLAAVKHGPTGSETINAGIVERLARRHEFNPDNAWYHGRPVIISRNDYRIGLFNGDVGIAMRDEHGQLRVWFRADEQPRSFLPSTLPAHDTAYAMTIHKSQGSEFDAVTLLLPSYDVRILTRELLYTGITRVRQRLTLYAPKNILGQTIQRRVARSSQLAERLAASR